MSAKLLPAGVLRETAQQGDATGWMALAGAAEGAGAMRATAPERTGTRETRSAFEEELAAVQNELRRVRAEAESGAGASYQSGFDAGFRKGLAQNQGEVDAFRAQIAATLHGAETARRELLEQADADLAKLSIAIAEKILNRQIQIDPEALQGLTRSALERLSGKTVQCVRIHPADRAAVEEALASHSTKRAIRVEPDASLSRGALLFDTDYGTLDASIATQLEEIESGLVDRLRRSAP
ncbi:MAG: hypothetical protein IT170_14345 [Bryobacterales bacterium]|nr:hypothetical protein [Bryobacterales bacterium]